ncbi:MAG: TauD/TfdA family dioxygenase [Pseudomonadales bacterium]
MRFEKLITGQRLPAVVTPDDTTHLGKFAATHRGAIDELLVEAGAILFRGFDITSADDLDEFVQAASTSKMDYVYGSTPRTHLAKGIYTATEYPPNQEIPLHSEVSYHTEWPKRIALCCLQPADENGATPLADLRRVGESAGAALVDEFARRRVMYVRHYHPYVDVPWQQVFQTENKKQVAQFCKKNNITLEWLADDVLRTVQICQGTITHPALNETFLFNQAHLFHVSSLDPEKAESLIEMFGVDRLPRNAFFGDGAEIEPEKHDAVRRAYAENAVDVDWQAGDVALVDNLQAAHGRRTFVGNRKVLAVLMDQTSEADLSGKVTKKRWWQRA